jgi:hypothetical protein
MTMLAADFVSLGRLGIDAGDSSGLVILRVRHNRSIWMSRGAVTTHTALQMACSLSR